MQGSKHVVECGDEVEHDGYFSILLSKAIQREMRICLNGHISCFVRDFMWTLGIYFSFVFRHPKLNISGRRAKVSSHCVAHTGLSVDVLT